MKSYFNEETVEDYLFKEKRITVTKKNEVISLPEIITLLLKKTNTKDQINLPDIITDTEFGKEAGNKYELISAISYSPGHYKAFNKSFSNNNWVELNDEAKSMANKAKIEVGAVVVFYKRIPNYDHEDWDIVSDEDNEDKDKTVSVNNDDNDIDAGVTWKGFEITNCTGKDDDNNGGLNDSVGGNCLARAVCGAFGINECLENEMRTFLAHSIDKNSDLKDTVFGNDIDRFISYSNTSGVELGDIHLQGLSNTMKCRIKVKEITGKEVGIDN